MIITKDMLKPGIYNERGRLTAVTRDDIDHLEKSVQVLHEAGYKIPLWLEHAPKSDRESYPIKSTDTELLSQAEGNPWFAGWLKGVNRDSNDVLSPELDVPDHLGERLVNAGTYLSPQFGEWDEIKEKAPMALLHVAFTRNPVNPDQALKFQEKSPSPLDTNSTSSQTAAQTLADVMQTGVKTFSFSLGHAVTFPNQQQSGGGQQQPGGTGSSTGQQQPPNGNQGQPGGFPPSDPQQALKQKLQQALQAMGIILDPNSPILQHPDHLSQVLSAIIAAEGQAVDKLKETQQPGMAGGSDSLTEQSSVIAMSQTPPAGQTQQTPAPGAVATPPNPLEAQLAEQAEKIRVMSQALVTQNAITAVLQKQISGAQIDGFNARIDKLLATGRCNAAQAATFRETAKTHTFSLEAPDAKSPLEMQLGVYESLPEGAFWSDAERLNSQNIQAHSFSQQLSGVYQGNGIEDVSEERANQVVAELSRLAHVPQYKQENISHAK